MSLLSGFIGGAARATEQVADNRIKDIYAQQREAADAQREAVISKRNQSFQTGERIASEGSSRAAAGLIASARVDAETAQTGAATTTAANLAETNAASAKRLAESRERERLIMAGSDRDKESRADAKNEAARLRVGLQDAQRRSSDATKILNDPMKRMEMTADELQYLQESRIEADNAGAYYQSKIQGKPEPTRKEYSTPRMSQADALAQAESEASDKAGAFRSDATDFPGGKQRWINDRAQELTGNKTSSRGLIDGDQPISTEAAPAQKAPPSAAPVVKSQQEYNKLPSGTRFTSPDGKTRIKP